MGSGGSRTTVQKADPWSGAQPYLHEIMEESQRLYQGGELAPEGYQGEGLAPQSALSKDALEGLENRARDGSRVTSDAYERIAAQLSGATTVPGQEYFQKVQDGAFQNGAIDQYQFLASGEGLRASPYLDQRFHHMADQVEQRVNQSAGLKGRTGSGAHQGLLQEGLSDLAQDVYAADYDRERQIQMSSLDRLADLYRQDTAERMAGASALFNGYSDERRRELDAAGMARQLASDEYTDLDRLLMTGRAQEEREQLELDDERRRLAEESNRAYENLARYNSLISGYAGVGGTTTSKEDTGGPSQTLSTVLSLARFIPGMPF